MADLPILSDLPQVLQEWIPSEASIAIADGERYIFYRAGGYDLRLRPGDPIRPGSVANRVFRIGKRVETDVDASVYGIPYHGLGYPLRTEPGQKVALTVILPPRTAAHSPEPSYVVGQQGDVWRPVPVGEIAWFESYDKRTWLHTADGAYTTRFTLRALEQRLSSAQFLRIHRSYLINVAWIEKIERDFHSSLLITLRAPLAQRLPVSQNYVHHVRQSLGF
ncbi:LytR/AlgR family response regulator transcription factor [Alicyclobacillus herbarius]|uniref:LytR/AlgR family response regulator transcription factor n=1 Tax=Alicyclobacillus herbarius TaxID=122960 RepID=UPI00040D3BEA|nr:LytTR family DNA-binding domain-containing protein [Alicyclobacillus herbarius]